MVRTSKFAPVDNANSKHFGTGYVIFLFLQELSQRLGDDKSISEHLKLPIQRINDYQLLLKVSGVLSLLVIGQEKLSTVTYFSYDLTQMWFALETVGCHLDSRTSIAYIRNVCQDATKLLNVNAISRKPRSSLFKLSLCFRRVRNAYSQTSRS